MNYLKLVDIVEKKLELELEQDIYNYYENLIGKIIIPLWKVKKNRKLFKDNYISIYLANNV